MESHAPSSAPTSSFTLDTDETDGGPISAESKSSGLLQRAASPGGIHVTSEYIKQQDTRLMSASQRHMEPVAVEQQQQQPGAIADSLTQSQRSPCKDAETTISDVLEQLTDNASAIRTAEEVLEHLVLKQSALMRLEQHLEQQLVISAVTRPLGFHKGRPVAAVLLLRCFQQWGVLTASEAPVLDQLLQVLQQQLESDDESAPADVPGLQCHVAYCLTISATLYCLLFKSLHPGAAAAALRAALGQQQSESAAAAVAAAARKHVGQLAQRFKGWGQQQQQQQQHGHKGSWLRGWGQQQQQQQQQKDTVDQTSPAAAQDPTAAAAVAAADTESSPQPEISAAQPPPAAAAAALQRQGTSSSSISSGSSFNVVPLTAAGTAAAAESNAAIHSFMIGLDQIVQRCYNMLRDQLKRRLAPLHADCMLMADQDDLNLVLGGGNLHGQISAQQQQQQQGPDGDQRSSSSDGAAAVAGAAAGNRLEAEIALMNFRCWSEVVGVLHAALVAVRSAGVPTAIRAMIITQVLQFINVQLFNQLLLRPECCNASNAKFVLRGLKQLDGWILHEQHTAAGSSSSSGSSSSVSAWQQPDQGSLIASAAAATAAAAAAGSSTEPGWEDVPVDTEFDCWQQQQQQQWHDRQQRRDRQQQQHQVELHDVGTDAWEALSHLREALQFLVLGSKGSLTFDDITQHICPSLSHQQLYRLCTTAWSDTADKQDSSVSGEVLEQMKQQYTLSTNGGLIVTFLLDEPAELPFVQQTANATSAGADTGRSTAPSSSVSFFGRQKVTSGAASAIASSAASSRCRATAVVLWDDLQDYAAGIPVPSVLLEGGGAGSVFSFLEGERPWPPHAR